MSDPTDADLTDGADEPFVDVEMEAIRDRLRPLLGDVKEHLGKDWTYWLDKLFSPIDLDVGGGRVEAIDHEPDQRWFAVDYMSNQGAIRIDNCLQCARSFEDAVGTLLTTCRDVGILPTHVDLNRAQSKLALWLEGEALARVHPIEFGTVEPNLRKRAETTVVGLRKFAHTEQEFLRRVQRWPGLASAESSHARVPFHWNMKPTLDHFPVRKEWLLAARLLCVWCKKPQPLKAAFVEGVAVAVFDAPSWHHVAARTAPQRPWHLSWDGTVEPSKSHLGYYADGFDALAALLRDAPQLGREWHSLGVGLHGWMDVPWFEICHLPAPPPPEEAHMPPPQFSLAQVVAMQAPVAQSPDDDVVEEVLQALSSKEGDAVGRLFRVGAPAAQRLEEADRRNAETHIATDGPWRFTAGDGVFIARFVDENGNTLHEAQVDLHKAHVLRWEGQHVLCKEYWGSSPELLLDGLSDATADLLARVLSGGLLRSPTGGGFDYDPDRDTYDNNARWTLGRLLEQQQQLRSMLR